MFHHIEIFKNADSVLAIETTRHGGVSDAPYASLNLGINTNDLPENIVQNRRLLFEQLGIETTQLAASLQVHDDKVLTTSHGGAFEGYDAIITNQSNVFVGVTVADCTPVLIYDAQNQAVAAIHAGWRGTVLQIVQKTLMAMQAQFGTQPQHCYAYVGTCIDACSFEVGHEVADQFADHFKTFDQTKQQYFVNLKAANAAQLEAFGIPKAHIQISEYDTVRHNEDYFSYRHENGDTGRMLVMIGLKQA
ncbi:MAG: peptidoglycan editing factor PgeF [Cytophagia bacterium]|nr:MAG: peptidoglycan editing factor PgeF [Cytophagales bacterium]TAG36135.1 MAG: peptidoglycan editing factor PgeF [Cytophagia bacterium]TAG57248.1 MAG: peptidoglycan editing factor PgeF [Runella slithyformis]TAG77516.1 MAG: peptidoglycan editing factor PgeF [Cytophagales bacterium]